MTLARPLLLTVAMLVLPPAVPAVAGPGASAPPPGAVIQRFDGAAQRDDLAVDVAVDPITGTAVVTGWVGTGPSTYSIGTIGYGADGTRLWTRTVSGEGFADAVGIDATRGLAYVAGTVYTPQTGVDVLVAAYGLDGAVRWERRFASGGASVYGLTVDETRGRVLVVGQDGLAALTVVYDASGQLLWSAEYQDNDPQALGRDVAVDPASGAVYVAGYGGLSAFGFRVLAYTADGALQWVRSYGPTTRSTSSADQVEVDPATGTVLVAGQIDTQASNRDVVLAAYAPDGTRRWLARYDHGGYDDVPTGLVRDPVTGRLLLSVVCGDQGVDGYCALAYDADGTLLWADRQGGPDARGDYPTDVAVDPERGLVFVTGQARLAARGLDYATLAYTIDGQYLGRSTYDGAFGDGSDTANAVAVDPVRGTLWVTGRSQGTNGDEDWATIAYPA